MTGRVSTTGVELLEIESAGVKLIGIELIGSELIEVESAGVKLIGIELIGSELIEVESAEVESTWEDVELGFELQE